MDGEWFDSKRASLYLASIGCGLSAKTLGNKRIRNNEARGPSFVRTGHKTVRYWKGDLDAYAARVKERVK